MSIDKDFFIWPTEFSCVLVIGNLIIPNHYTLNVGMMPNTIQGESTIHGLKKIKQFINKFVQNSILIAQDHTLIQHLNTTKTNIIQLPDDPYDYYFALILFHKLNAISSDYFTVHEITIDSSVGDRVKYQINRYGDELNGNAWWNQDNVKTNDNSNYPSWEDLDLNISKFSPKVVKGGKHENKPI